MKQNQPFIVANHFSQLNRRTQGFTLIELLIVLVIVGVMMSLISLNIGSRPSSAKQAAEQIQQLLTLAREEAILKGQILAWKLTSENYSFYGYKNKSWLLLNDTLLRTYRLPEELDYSLSVESAKENSNQNQNQIPQVLLLPDGSISRFNLIIHPKDDSENYTVFIQQGKIKAGLLAIKP
jgi:general secretion pathway protein H